MPGCLALVRPFWGWGSGRQRGIEKGQSGRLHRGRALQQALPGDGRWEGGEPAWEQNRPQDGGRRD